MKFDWEGIEKAINVDPDNQTNKNNGKQISQNERININNNSGGKDPRIKSLTWEVKLPEISNFNIYTDKSRLIRRRYCFTCCCNIINQLQL